MKSRTELDRQLDELAEKLPAMTALDDAEFWPEFAGLADDIADNAGPDDYDHVHQRLDAMLVANGKGTD